MVVPTRCAARLGDDTLLGSDGADLLAGGAGNNRLTGGRGADQFTFGKRAETTVVADFTDGVDVLAFAGSTGRTRSLSAGRMPCRAASM